MPWSPRQGSSAHGPNSSVQVLSVPDNLPIIVRFLGPVLGLETHWRSGRSIPCPGPGDCPSTIHRTGTIWKGYAPVEAWEPANRHWRSWVLEVTESLEEQLRGRDLRGEVWILSRIRKHGKADPINAVYSERFPEEKLSKCFEIHPVLIRLFHVSELRLGACNPLPPKVMIEPVKGDAPTLPPELVNVDEPADNAEKKRSLGEMIREKFGRGKIPSGTNGKTEGNGQEQEGRKA